MLTGLGAVAVTLTAFLGADKPLERGNAQAQKAENITGIQRLASDILEEEKRLRFVEQRLMDAKDVVAKNSSVRLKEQFADMDDEYRKIQQARLQQQQRYAELMQDLLTAPGVSEKQAQLIYNDFANNVRKESYNQARVFFFPMRDEFAFRDECFAQVQSATPASPPAEISKSVLACARSADNKHDVREIAIAGAAGLGFSLSAYFLPLVMSRRRKKPETAIKQVVTIVAKHKP